MLDHVLDHVTDHGLIFGRDGHKPHRCIVILPVLPSPLVAPVANPDPELRVRHWCLLRPSDGSAASDCKLPLDPTDISKWMAENVASGQDRRAPNQLICDG